MSRYDDYRSSTGTLESRDRYSRGPPVLERERPRRFEERFESRLQDEDRYGPPARAPGRYYEDEHLSHPSGPLVAHDRRRRRDDSPSFAPPRLVRRQSSLDTFDRIPPRKRETLERERAPRMPRAPHAPSHQPSPGRYREREIYEDIRIAEPDYYGDEEYRELQDRERVGRRRSSSSAARHRHEEKPYPRKGKTRIPRKWVHVHAILDLGYPFREEDTIVIQKALSKQQIDDVISLSREFRRPAQAETEYLRLPRSPFRERPRERVTTEHLVMEAHHSPRSSHDAFIVDASPSHHRDFDYEEVIERPIERPRYRAVSRPRSVSVHQRRRLSSPVRIEPHHHLGERIESSNHGSMVLVRPRHSEHDVSDYIRDLEEETRLLRLEREGGIEITRQRETDTFDDRGNAEEVTEVRRQDRRGR
ncbi:hypothetical protein N7492_005391 [Penicillium capsulatum]|uniref:DUF8035 domain-containing protein n=1 Tax=Penicillium capsulatum TaxID=69766 RepID=A0A9W9IBT5_9EURO|nr:hypothetical protein N7492_005391 [Penicillium capsulatum]